MTHTHTTLEVYSRSTMRADRSGLQSVVSLHSHSSCSREKLTFIPGLARQVPVVCRQFERSLETYRQRHGRPLDFSQICWRPPLSPAAVIDSERRQAEQRFELPALVSLTDHDTFEGPRSLRASGRTEVPLSFEWSITFRGSTFHLGVHGLSADGLQELEPALAACTANEGALLPDLLRMIGDCPDSFVVLNHPCWDMAGVGRLRHDASLLAFLRQHHEHVHALELNGYRTWAENRQVLPLADGFGLPVVGGGDRHGYAPNAIVNVSHATTFREFAHLLRHERVSHCVVMPEYETPFVSRVLESASDILRPDARGEGLRWEDRVFVSVEGVDHPVDAIWNGAPAWVGACVAGVRLLGSAAVRPVFELTRTDGHRTLVADCGSGATASPAPAAAAQPSWAA